MNSNNQEPTDPSNTPSNIEASLSGQRGNEGEALILGFSPCPNDTFIFDALVNGKIDTEGLTFDVQLEDVQTLNQWALDGKLDISKISYGVLPLILDKYIVLNSGGALGKGVGPLLISNTQPPQEEMAIQQLVTKSLIALPGINTTAHFLFAKAFPQATNKVFLRFDEIENAVLHSPANGQNVLGVIIHENRFTYYDRGLYKIRDLGNYWEEATGNPIPLGGIVMKKSFDTTLQQKVDRLIHKSLEYAFANYPQLTDYVRQHSQEMQETVMRQHIDLYVNNYSLNLGKDGKQAVLHLLETYESVNDQRNIDKKEIFLEED
jgi:1,4-dihydroxy-6-naphthoate synthase